MKFETLTLDQIQQIYFELKNQKALKMFFGDKYESCVLPLLKSGQLRKPTDYLASLGSAQFTDLLFKHDGSKNLSRHYGVSNAFVRTLWRKHLDEQAKEGLTKEELLSGLEQFGSVRMLCRLLSVKESEVRKVAKEASLELAPYLTFEFGDYAVNKGRKAELHWKSLRGTSILKDMNEEESSQADYDFQDAEFGNVNVKSSKRYKFKAKTRKAAPYHWLLSTSSLEKCDYAIGVLYDPAFENAMGWVVIKSEDALALGKQTITITKVDLDTKQTNGRILSFSWF